MVKRSASIACVVLLGALMLLQPALAQTFATTNKFNTKPEIADDKLFRAEDSVSWAIGSLQEYSSVPFGCLGGRLTDSISTPTKSLIKCFDLVTGADMGKAYYTNPTPANGIVYGFISFTMTAFSGTSASLYASNNNSQVMRFDFTIAPATRKLTFSAPTLFVKPAGTADYQALLDHPSSANLWSVATYKATAGAEPPINANNYLVKFVKATAATTTPIKITIEALKKLYNPYYFLYYYSTEVRYILICGDLPTIVLYDTSSPDASPISFVADSPVAQNRGPITLYNGVNNKKELVLSEVNRVVYRVEIADDFATNANFITLKTSGSLIAAVPIAGMKGVPLLKAFIVAFTGASAFELVQMFDMATQRIPLPNPTTLGTFDTMVASLIMTSLKDSKLNLAMIYRTPSREKGGIQTYELTLETCSTARTGKICSTCAAGYALDVVNAIDNQCLRKVESGALKGPDVDHPGTFYYCGDGCETCALDYRKCQTCSDATHKLVKFSETNIRCLATLPKGYGKDPQQTSTPIIYVACTANCVDCDATNINKCLDCRDKFSRKEAADASTITCEALPITGWGLDTADVTGNPIYRPCTAANLCAKCPDDKNMCTECATSTFNRVQTTASEIKCIDNTGFNQQFGLSLAQSNNYFVKCTDNNCDNCQADFAECSACKASFTLIKETRSAKKTCLADSQIASRLAWSSNGATPPVLEPCTIDNCVNCQASKDICKECTLGKFLHFKTASTPQYTCEASITAAFGLDSTVAGFTNLYKPCDSLCKSCEANVKACTKCTADADFRIYKSATDITCQASTTAIADGYGKNVALSTATDLLYAVCTDSDCKKCLLNIDICTECKTAGNSLKTLSRAANSKIICVPDATEEAGYGFKVKDETIQPCTDLSCITCPTDINICQECATPKLLKYVAEVTTGSPTPAVYTCETAIVASAGFGLTIPDSDGFVRVYQKCCDHCLQCLDNVQKCTQCEAGYNRVQTTADKIECISDTGFNIKFGRNIYLVPAVNDPYFTRCEQDSCDLCHDNYESCTKCATDYRLVTTTTPEGPIISTCVATANAPCSMAGCVDCTGDIDKCKKCDCNKYFLKRVGSSPSYTVTCETTQPTTFGYVIPDEAGLFNAMAPCETRCKTCTANVKVCTECLDSSDKRYNFSPTDMQCKASSVAVVAGYGLNNVGGATNYYTACLYENCDKCDAKYSICEACKANYILQKITADANSDIKCAPTAAIPKGYGKDIKITTPPIIKLCSVGVADCVSCNKDDNTICQECAAGKFLKYVAAVTTGTPAPAVYTCESALPAESGFGLTIPDSNSFVKLYQKCLANCDQCLNDVQKCTKCQSGYNRVQTTADKIQCISQTGFNIKFGRNVDLVPAATDPYFTACQQVECDLCIANYKSCTKCAAPYSPIKLDPKVDVMTCVLPSDAYCESKGCVKCPDDRTICKECDCKNYFLKRTAAGVGVCVDELTAGYGYIIPDAEGLKDAVDVCDSTRCKECFDNTKECTKCKETTDNIINKGVADIKCQVSTAAIPAGYGLNGVQYYTACKYEHCSDCKDAYNICKTCDASYTLLKITNDATSDVKCVPTTPVPKGYGLDLAISPTNIFKLCTTVDCERCPEDRTVCEECATPKFLKYVEAVTTGTPPTPAAYTCENSLVATSGFGLTVPNENGFVDIYQKCCDGCDNCFNDLRVCTVCQATHYRVYRNPLDVTCELKAGFDKKFGKNQFLDSSDANILSACKQTGCKNCLTDFQSCTACTDATDVLVKWTSDDPVTCVPVANKPTKSDGYGMTGGGFYAKCTQTGCIDCYADNTVCKECDCDHSLKNTATSGSIVAECKAVLQASDNFGVDWKVTDYVDLYQKCPTGCDECLDDVDACTKCASGYNRIFTNAQDIKCVATSTALPAKYGLNKDLATDAQDLLQTPCNDANCAVCTADYSICTSCAAGFKLWKDSRENDDVTCKADATVIPEGFGLNVATSTYMHCDDLDCKICSETDNLVCKECKTKHLHKTTGTPDVYECKATVDSKFGLVTPDANGFISLYLACDSKCDACLNDYTKCTSCTTQTDFRINRGATGIVCEAPTATLDGFGRNKVDDNGDSDLYYSPCKYANCIKCFDNYAICTDCQDATFFKMYLTKAADTEVKCVASTYTQDHYGLNGVSILVPCKDDSCTKCQSQYDICTECDSPKLLKYTAQKTVGNVVTPQDYSCVATLVAADGYGYTKVASNVVYKECLDGCAECLKDRGACTKCKSNQYIREFRSETDILCKSVTGYTGGFGRNTNVLVSGTTDPNDLFYTKCRQSTCLNCQARYDSCVLCSSNTELVRSLENSNIVNCVENNVYALPQPNSGLGPLTVAPNPKIWEKCQLADCKNCQSDNTICKECIDGRILQRSPSGDFSCYTVGTPAAFYGKMVPADAFFINLHVKCFGQCERCASNYKACTKCQFATNKRVKYADDDIQCKGASFNTDGYGLDPTGTASDLYYTKCSAHCDRCDADSRVCATCATGFSKVKPTTADPDIICVQNGNVVVHAKAATSSIAAHFQQCSVLGCKNCTSDSTECKECVAGKHLVTWKGKLVCASEVVEEAIAQPAVFQVGTEAASLDADELNLNSSTMKLANVLQYTIKLFGFAFKVLLMPLDFFMSFTVDSVVSTFSYLKLVSTPETTEANKIIDLMSSRTLFGFKISNPFLEWTNAPECKVPKSLTVHSLQCSLFYNYGHNMGILLASLVLAIMVLVVTSVSLMFGADPNSSLNKWMKVANYYFGLRYFFLFMHGVFLDLFGLAILNISVDSTTSSAVGAGRTLSVVVLVFYVNFYAVTAYSIKSKITLFKAGQSATSSPVLSYFSFLTDAFRFSNNQSWLLYMALFWPAKSALAVIVSNLTRESDIGQLIPVFTVEVVALLILIATRAKKRMVDNAFDIIFQFLLCVYIGIQLILRSKQDDIDLQGSAINTLMTGTLYTMAIVAIIYLTFRALVSAFKLKSNATLTNVLLPPVVETQEACILLDESAAWTSNWK